MRVADCRGVSWEFWDEKVPVPAFEYGGVFINGKESR